MGVLGFQSSLHSDYLGRRAVVSQDVVTVEGVAETFPEALSITH